MQAPFRTGSRRSQSAPSARDPARPGPRTLATRLTIVYVGAASLWIVFSDRLLGMLGLPIAVERELSSAKGILFVVATGFILWLLAVHWLDSLRASEERYARLFENATEGLTVFHVERDTHGGVGDLVVDDMNPTQSERQHTSPERARGLRMTDCDPRDERMCAHFAFVADLVRGDGPSRTELHVEMDDRYELLMAFPISPGLWALAALDVTEVRRAELALQRQQEGIRQAYVDVIDAVTGGKLVLLPEEELAARLGRPLGPMVTFATAAELSQARRAIVEAASARFPGRADERSLTSAACEALNNALKHAGGGSYQVFAQEERVQVVVIDHGPGIDFRTLPRAALVPGFSTIASLGMGFSIMLQLTERVLLTTRPGRTQLVLEVAAEGR